MADALHSRCSVWEEVYIFLVAAKIMCIAFQIGDTLQFRKKFPRWKDVNYLCNVYLKVYFPSQPIKAISFH